MNPVDRQTLARKLDFLRKQLDLLDRYRALPAAEFAMDEKRYAVERLLEVSIQSVIDLSRLLTALEDWRRPGDDRDAFLVLADRGALPIRLAEDLLRAKAFRNILVHEYVEIDQTLLVEHLQEDVADLREFAFCVAKQLR